VRCTGITIPSHGCGPETGIPPIISHFQQIFPDRSSNNPAVHSPARTGPAEKYLAPDIEVYADALIVRVLYNLIDNAVRQEGPWNNEIHIA
jgi:signal transduction histidine kinase